MIASKKIYNWKRYLCPLGSEGIHLGLSGFLIDPEDEFGFSNAHLKSLGALTEKQCLILLGEPGIGKSKTLEIERPGLESVTSSSGESIWLDLRTVGSTLEIDTKLFNNAKFTSWLTGSRKLYVYLDSLDECTIRTVNLKNYLPNEIRERSGRNIDRLYLRIACRTADWLLFKMGDALRSLWKKDDAIPEIESTGKGELATYELVTLRQKDIEQAATDEGIDADEFVNQVFRQGLVSLASKPMTLRMLLGLYANGQMQTGITKRTIYMNGCEILAEETRDGMKQSGMGTRLDVSQRIGICQRIAALMIFGNRSLITLDSLSDALPEGSYRTSDLSGGSEEVAGNKSEVTEGRIEEVLKTGLFSARGENALGWAHQSYAEYLAAEWINRSLGLEQIKSLLFYRESTGYKSIPKLREISIWLAAINVKVRELVKESEPELLLKCDPATLSDEMKLGLASSILDKFVTGVWSDHDLYDMPHANNLACVGLENILRPILPDKALPRAARRCAIYMAFHCKVQSVQDQIADIILDQTEEPDLRQSAGLYTSEVADTNCRRRLKVLWPLKVDDDGNSLAHWLLRALWPANLTAEELFQDDAIRTIDKMWDYKAILNGLRPTDLPLALEWVSRQGSRHQLGYTLDKFLNGIMVMGWKHMQEPGVAVPFAQAAFSRLQHHDDIIQEEDRKVPDVGLFQDSDKLRTLIANIVNIMAERKIDHWYVSLHNLRLKIEGDFEWLIKKIAACSNPEERTIWAYTIRIVTNQLTDLPFEVADAIILQSLTIPELSTEFELPFVDLESQRAKNQKKYFYDAQQWQNRPEPKPPSLASLVAPLPFFLAEFEKGDLRRWIDIVRQLSAIIMDSRVVAVWSDTDLLSGPIWTALDLHSRNRIVNAAKVYLVEGDPHNDEWLSGENDDLRAIAGFQALNILLSEEPSYLETLKPNTWRKWAAVILTFRGGSRLEMRLLIQRAYENAPEEILAALAVRLRGSGNHAYSLFNGQLQYIWDDTISQSLLDLVKTGIPTPWADGLVLEELMDRYSEVTLQWLRSQVADYKPGDDKCDRIVIYVRVLVNKTHDADWDLVWQLIQLDLETGKAVAFVLASNRHQDESPLLQKLSSQQLADLYIWVETNFPHTEDPVHTGASSPGPRDDVASWRASIIGKLENIGAFVEIDRINQVFKHEWLAATSRRAAQRFRDLNWNPVDPRSLIKMAQDNQSRIVSSPDHLLTVVLESLQRYEAHLQHDGAWRDIWNLSDGKWTPHTEDEFSDHIKRFLDADLMQKGIIINREVRINVVGREYDRTDLQIDAVVVDRKGQDVHAITLIVEVKKSNSREVFTSMTNQLAEKYLKGKGLTHGIYLVGWFGTDQTNRGMTIEQILGELTTESDRLFAEGFKVEAIGVNAERKLAKGEVA